MLSLNIDHVNLNMVATDTRRGFAPNDGAM